MRNAHVTIKGGIYLFKVTGSTLIFDGFLKVYGVEEDDEEDKVKIPKDLKEKDSVDLSKIETETTFYPTATSLYRSIIGKRS